MMTLSSPAPLLSPADTRNRYRPLPAYLALVAMLSACAQGPVAPTSQASRPVTETANPDAAPNDDRLKATMALMSSGHYQEAIEPLREQIKVHPNRPELYANLGIAYARARRLEDAENAFKAALERHFEHAELYNQLGVVYREMGRFKEAEQAYLSALRVDPKHANAELNLGILLELYLQEPERALPHFQAYETLRDQDGEEVSKWIKDIERRRRDGEL